MPYLINEDQQLEIIESYMTGSTIRELGNRYGVSKATIHRILVAHNFPRRPTGRRKIINISSRICSKCKTEKPIEEFIIDPKMAIGRGYRCKSCHNKAQRNKSIEYNFGISIEQFEMMEKAQGGKCAICRKKETRKRGGRVARLSVDHDHITGDIRGLLCTRCNTAIGLLEDDIKLLKNAIDYLISQKASKE